MSKRGGPDGEQSVAGHTVLAAPSSQVREWGARQLAIGCVFTFALTTKEPVAYQAALIALLARAGGDVVANLINGCT